MPIKDNRTGRGIHYKKKNSEKKPPSFEHPVFCFKYLDDRWGLKNLDKNKKSGLLEQLCKLSSLTWTQINSSGRHGMGKENINPGTSGLKCKLPPDIYSEDSNIYALRYSNNLPFVGIRSGFVFHLLGIDHNFTLYNHGS